MFVEPELVNRFASKAKAVQAGPAIAGLPRLQSSAIDSTVARAIYSASLGCDSRLPSHWAAMSGRLGTRPTRVDKEPKRSLT